MGFIDKIKDLLSQNTDKVDAAIEKVGDIVDSKTGDKYKGAVDKVQETARNAVDSTKAPEAAPQAPSAGPPPTS